MNYYYYYHALWAPWFSLPTVDTMTQTLMPGYWRDDDDYGEMFLNFPLHRELQKYCGVDLSQLYGHECFGMWTRNTMGLKPSPYSSVQGSLRAKRKMLSDRNDESNTFHWKSVVLNLPGTMGMIRLNLGTNLFAMMEEWLVGCMFI